MNVELPYRPAAPLLELIEAVKHGVQDIRADVRSLPCGDRLEFRVGDRVVTSVIYAGAGMFAPGGDLSYQTNLAGCAARVTQLMTAALIDQRLTAVAARRQADALNRVVHTRNLYRGGSRFINAQVKRGAVMVENLCTGDLEPFRLEDGGWRDGRGRLLTTEDFR